MNQKTEPTTTAGRALAAWGRRSQAMAGTIARIETEAVADWLVSAHAETALAAALARHVECGRDGPRYDVQAILGTLRA